MLPHEADHQGEVRSAALWGLILCFCLFLAAAIPFAVLLYMIPLCYAATKKRLYQPRERKETT